MHPWLPALLALSVAADGAQNGERPPEKKEKLPASSLLPDGSQLHGVVVPRHNKQRVLVNSLTADIVTLVNDETMSGERVIIDFFDNRGKRDARIKLKQATFHQNMGMLHASENVTMDAETYKARGTGLHYAIRRSQGLLSGPVITWIINTPHKSAMKPKAPALISAAGIALIAQSGDSADAQNTALKPEPVKVNSVSNNPIGDARDEAREQLKKAIESSSTSDKEVKEFVEHIPLDYQKLTGDNPTPSPSKPMSVEPSPEHTVINCEGGMYFDSDKGHLVYLKKVEVKDPQYILTGADVLRVYMAKKPAKAKVDSKDQKHDNDKAPANSERKQADTKPSPDKGPVPTIGGSFDSVEKIVATGAVRILQKSVDKGKQPVEASGALFTYYPETGDILLSGGYPWVKQGDFYARAKQPNLTLRMKKNGDFVTEGNWEMGGRLNQKKKPGPKPEPKPVR